MRKKGRKLHLSSETLRHLTAAESIEPQEPVDPEASDSLCVPTCVNRKSLTYGICNEQTYG